MLDLSFSINLDLEEIGRPLKDSSLLYVLMMVHSKTSTEQAQAEQGTH